MMDKPTCKYTVRSRVAYLNNETGELEFLASERQFTDLNPIVAREKAFRYRNLIIAGIIDTGTEYNLADLGWDESLGVFSNASDRELRKILNQFFPPNEAEDRSETVIIRNEDSKEEIVWIPPDDTLGWYTLHKSGIWVILEHNDADLKQEDVNYESDYELIIDKFTRFDEPLPNPPFYANLCHEYELYRKHGFDTNNLVISVDFLDDEAYLNGDENYFRKLSILKTEFDWTGYDKMEWWEKEPIAIPVEKDTPSELPYSIHEAFAKGENHFTEYKPGLINRPNSHRDIEFEIVKTINAFLNREGGYLFIGVADKKQRIIGLEFPEGSQDKFLREFTRIKLRHLPPHIAHTIKGDFYKADDRMIFGVTIQASDAPVFLKIKDENNKVIGKQFYVRSDAASRHLYDIEEIVKYCMNRWK